MLRFQVGGPASGAPPGRLPQGLVEARPTRVFAGFSADRAAGGLGVRRWPVAPGAPPGRLRRLRPVSGQPAIGDDLGAHSSRRQRLSSGWCCWRYPEAAGAARHSRGIRAVRGFPGQTSRAVGEGLLGSATRSGFNLGGSAPWLGQPLRATPDLSAEKLTQLGMRVGRVARRAGRAEWVSQAGRKPGSVRQAEAWPGRSSSGDRCYQRPPSAALSHLCRTGVLARPLSLGLGSQPGLPKPAPPSALLVRSYRQPLHPYLCSGRTREPSGWMVSVALVSRSPALGVTQQAWPWGSPDFPQRTQSNRPHRANVPLDCDHLAAFNPRL